MSDHTPHPRWVKPIHDKGRRTPEQDWVNVVAGVWLIIAPFALGTVGEAASTWTAVILGVLAALAALWALGQPGGQTPEWTNVVLGVLLFLAPWALAYTAVAAASWNAWILGAIVAIAAGWALPETRSPRLAPDTDRNPSGRASRSPMRPGSPLLRGILGSTEPRTR